MPRSLTALAILPNRNLAQELSRIILPEGGFDLLADCESYPPLRTLGARIAHLQPEVVFLDVATELNRATEIIRFITTLRPPVQVVALHTHNEPGAILQSLRAGACEFLYAPFDADMAAATAGRIAQLVQTEIPVEAHCGKVVAFSAAKPGSGASTLASQIAFALRKKTGERILLADFDLWTGTIGFFFRLNQEKLNHGKLQSGRSLLDALQIADEIDEPRWASLVFVRDGIDILPAPPPACRVSVDPAKLHGVLQFARSLYDWILIDLPSIFVRLSLTALSESDRLFLISTTELSSLHLTRKAVRLLERMGFGKDRFHIIVNRAGSRDEVTCEAMAKIFSAPVHASFPNDYLALHQALAGGQPLESSCALGQAVNGFASSLAGAGSTGDKKTAVAPRAV